MKLKEHPMEWYLDKMRKNEYFSLGMFGDGEWQAIFNASGVAGRKFEANCEGTKYDPKLCEELLESLKYEGKDFLFSAPNTFKIHNQYLIYEKWVDQTLEQLGVDIEFVEKNVWNEEMKAGGLSPLIKELRKKNVCVISNEKMKGLDFLRYDKFIKISYPNCYLDGSLDRAYEEAIAYGKPGVYLIAAGIPAALLAQKLHKAIPESFVLDLGSIFDGFVGTGGQRSFRANLYENPDQMKEWRQKNLHDIN